MNKKLLSGILACCMALGCMVPVAGCKPEESGQGGGQNTEQNGGQNTEQNGEQSNQGNQGGEQNKPDDKPQKDETIAPGTVITDVAAKAEFYDALSKSRLNGFTYSASANLELKVGESVQTRKFTLEGAILLEDTVKADAYLTFSSDAEEEAGTSYYLGFLRGGTLYSAMGEETEGAKSFTQLKEALKAEKDPLVLDKTTLEDRYLALAKSKTVYQIVKNMPTLFEGVLEKTEGGYTLSFDVGRSLFSFLTGFRPLAEAFDADHEMTLGALFGQESLKGTLEKLLKNVTAEELVETFSPILPEEIVESLPKPAKGEAAAVYVDGLLRSGSFFKALTGEGEEFKNWKTFAEVPLKELLGLITGEEFTFEPTATARFDQLLAAMKSELVETLFAFAGVEEGELSDDSLQLSMFFSFDEEKHLLGFSADALSKGVKTQSTQPTEKEEEEMSPEEENGTETESKSEKKARENAQKGETEQSEAPGQSGENAQEDGQRKELRATGKLAAAGASSPELFDLTGCKVRTEEGKTTTIK